MSSISFLLDVAESIESRRQAEDALKSLTGRLAGPVDAANVLPVPLLENSAGAPPSKEEEHREILNASMQASTSSIPSLTTAESTGTINMVAGDQSSNAVVSTVSQSAPAIQVPFMTLPHNLIFPNYFNAFQYPMGPDPYEGLAGSAAHHASGGIDGTDGDSNADSMDQDGMIHDNIPEPVIVDSNGAPMYKCPFIECQRKVWLLGFCNRDDYDLHMNLHKCQWTSRSASGERRFIVCRYIPISYDDAVTHLEQHIECDAVPYLKPEERQTVNMSEVNRTIYFCSWQTCSSIPYCQKGTTNRAHIHQHIRKHLSLNGSIK